MTSLRTLLAAVSLAVALTACEGSSLVLPGEARYDNGSTMGTGHRSSEGGVATTTASSDTMAARNGSTMGTGH